ncbi:MAG: cation diffusion facilitator family transporter [Thermoanaerobaculia bacterium]
MTYKSIFINPLFLNLINLFLLHKFQKKSLNIRSAYLHILSDSLGSLLVILSALLLFITKKTYFDSLASIFISFLILYSSIKLFLKTLNILMEGVPKDFKMLEIYKDLKDLPEVQDIHDLHIWSITSNFPILTAHIVIKEEKKGQEVLKKANEVLKEKYKINHSTLQLETSFKKECEQANGNCPGS